MIDQILRSLGNLGKPTPLATGSKAQACKEQKDKELTFGFLTTLIAVADLDHQVAEKWRVDKERGLKDWGD